MVIIYHEKFFRCQVKLKLKFELESTDTFPGMDYGICIMSASGQRLTTYATWMLKEKVDKPKKILLEIPKLNFSSGSYHIYLSMTHPKEGIYIDRIENAIGFHIESVDVFNTGRTFDSDLDYGVILPEGKFLLI